MDTDIIQVVDAVSTAKDMEREIIFEAIESAIESATKKKYSEDMDVKVKIDRETGMIQENWKNLILNYE